MLIENTVEKIGNEWCVVHGHPKKPGSKTDKPKGTVIKCFPTKKEAEAMHRAIMANINVDLEELEKRINRLIKLLEEENPEIEDWEYLLHRIYISDTGSEEIYHCPVMDHLGNLYKVEHLEGEGGKYFHCITGLEEDQVVYWSDEEAMADGNKVPCADRQLES